MSGVYRGTAGAAGPTYSSVLVRYYVIHSTWDIQGSAPRAGCQLRRQLHDQPRPMQRSPPSWRSNLPFFSQVRFESEKPDSNGLRPFPRSILQRLALLRSRRHLHLSGELARGLAASYLEGGAIAGVCQALVPGNMLRGLDAAATTLWRR